MGLYSVMNLNRQGTHGLTMQKCLVQYTSLSEIVKPQRNLTYLDMTQAYETRAIQDVRYTLAFRLD